MFCYVSEECGFRIFVALVVDSYEVGIGSWVYLGSKVAYGLEAVCVVAVTETVPDQ